jgi:TolB-like protein/DNA-binding winged helix-turn-helix (wHTH) protein/Tfp pilus assembly protein PilF
MAAPVLLAREAPFDLADLHVEPALRRISRVDGATLTLEPLVMQVLVALARAGGAVVTRDELVERCWGGRIVGDDSISRVISRLRKVAAGFAQGAFAIETTARVGFRLVHDQEVPAGAAAPASATTRRSLLVGGGLVALAAAGAAAWFAGGDGAPAGPAAVQRLAVLPLANVSEGAGQQYFADGMTEELRDRLARLPSVDVAARTSSIAAHTQGLDAKAIGRELGVGVLIEGSVRRSGDMVRVTATLIDTQTGFPRWSQSYDRKLDDVFAIQGDIAQAVTGEVLGRLGGGEAARLARSATVNPEAFDAYAKGRALFDLSADRATYRAALAAFDRAVALDPNYAAAWGQRARVLAVLANQYAAANELRGLYDAGLASARRAVALAPQSADAHAALAYQLVSGRLDFANAAKSYQSAYRFGAHNADILIPYASFAVRTGRGRDALTAVERAVRLDPLNPRSHFGRGYVLSALRRYRAALPPLRKALALSPEMSTVHGAIGVVLLMLGQAAEARQEFFREPTEFVRLTGLAIVEDEFGNRDAARAAMARLIATPGDAAA